MLAPLEADLSVTAIRAALELCGCRQSGGLRKAKECRSCLLFKPCESQLRGDLGEVSGGADTLGCLLDSKVAVLQQILKTAVVGDGTASQRPNSAGRVRGRGSWRVFPTTESISGPRGDVMVSE